MSKTADGFPLAIKLDFESDVRLRWQVYEGIREAILSGRLGPGARLPASRILAAELGLSRPTVSEAYRILRDEGYVWSRVGSGTFVASKLPDELLGAARVDGDVGQGEGPTPSPSRRCFTLAGAAEEATLPVVRPRPFRHYGPDVEEFPWGLWAKLTARVYRRVPPEVLATGYPAGYEPLREAVASYVAPMRGVRCVPGQVIIASGGTHAIDLAIRFLLDPDDRAWIEEPAFPNTFATLVAAGARPVPVPVDEGGLNVEAGKASAPHARLAMVTPSHHTPLGVTMKLRRRLELLAWAREANAWIFENDYDSEYRHAGPSLAALQGLDADGRVVYMGSFSPTLFWGLRLAYLIVPERLTGIFSAARHTLDIYTHTIQQVVLADFIAEGHLARHLRRMRLLYARRQETLLRSARNELIPNPVDPLVILLTLRWQGAREPQHPLKPCPLSGTGLVIPECASLQADSVSEVSWRLAATRPACTRSGGCRRESAAKRPPRAPVRTGSTFVPSPLATLERPPSVTGWCSATGPLARRRSRREFGGSGERSGRRLGKDPSRPVLVLPT